MVFPYFSECCHPPAAPKAELLLDYSTYLSIHWMVFISAFSPIATISLKSVGTLTVRARSAAGRGQCLALPSVRPCHMMAEIPKQQLLQKQCFTDPDRLLTSCSNSI